MKLNFTPLEFKTLGAFMDLLIDISLNFTPLEFKTGYISFTVSSHKPVKFYSVGV